MDGRVQVICRGGQMCGNGRGRGQAQSEVGGRARDVNINTRHGGRRYASQSVDRASTNAAHDTASVSTSGIHTFLPRVSLWALALCARTWLCAV